MSGSGTNPLSCRPQSDAKNGRKETETEKAVRAKPGFTGGQTWISISDSEGGQRGVRRTEVLIMREVQAGVPNAEGNKVRNSAGMPNNSQTTADRK